MRRSPLESSLLLTFAITGFLVAAQGCAQHMDSFMLADTGKSAYRIVIAKEASDSEKRAAEELQTFLKQIADVQLPIRTDEMPPSERQILLGRTPWDGFSG